MDTLAVNEKRRLAELEAVDKAMQSWAISYRPRRGDGYAPTSTPAEVGKALKEIRDKKLFRDIADSFYVYCARRFGLRPERVDSYIAISEGGQVLRPTRADENPERSGMVYFLAGGGLVKIGYTTSLQKRLSSIRNMSPVSLELLGIIDAGPKREKEIHDRFNDLRQHGEWFRLTPPLKQFIQEHGR